MVLLITLGCLAFVILWGGLTDYLFDNSYKETLKENTKSQARFYLCKRDYKKGTWD